MRKLFAPLLLPILFIVFNFSASADTQRESDYLITFDRLFVKTGVNDSGQTPQEVTKELVRKVDGLSRFEYIPDIGFVASLTDDALKNILAHPDTSTEFSCEGWKCTCQDPIDCAWLSWYCSAAGGISGFDDECYLP